MLNCACSNSILQFLIRILKKAGKLSYGCKINMFLFENYPINSIENISLMFTWKHIYNSKYSNDSLLCVPYAFVFKILIAVITHMSLPLTLTAMDILNILDHELKPKTWHNKFRTCNLEDFSNLKWASQKTCVQIENFKDVCDS